jgi:hypothetical protein
VFSPQKPCPSNIALRLHRASGQEIDRGSTEMNRVPPNHGPVSKCTITVEMIKVINGRKVCSDRTWFRLVRTVSRMNPGSDWALSNS